MNILHICNDYTGSKVHSCLYKELDKKGIQQTIYTYFDGKKRTPRNEFLPSHTKFIFSDILTEKKRKVFWLKREIVYHDLSKKVKLSSFDLTSATTLYSDGCIAYRIYRKRNIPYILAVRSTDINVFMSFKILWPLGKKILTNSSRIIFISPALLNEFKNHPMIRKIWGDIEEKVIIQSNGIDSYWIDNINLQQRNNNHNICYVGSLIKRKNLIRLIHAVKKLEKKYSDIGLYIAGQGGEYEEEVKIESNICKFIHYEGAIKDRNKLRDLYRTCSVFAMPSFSETFGLVYIEALTQNLALLYSKGTGIDGLLNNVGVAVNPNDEDEIVKALDLLFETYKKYNTTNDIDFSRFEWSTIADNYIHIYNEIV